MDFYLENRSLEQDESSNLMLLGQILNNRQEQPNNPFQQRYRTQLVRQLKLSTIPGGAAVTSWAEALTLAEDLSQAEESGREDVNNFSFDMTALDMAEVRSYFNRPGYTGPPLVACLASGANGRCYLLENTLWDGQNPDIYRYLLNTETEHCKAVPIGNVALVSPQQELSCVAFLDEKKLSPDWSTTISNLKKFGINSEYSYEMIKTALMTFVRGFRPADQEILASMDANSIARYLLKASQGVDRNLYHMERLERCSRKQGEPLQEAMARVRLLAGQIYPGQNGAKHRDRILLRALASFVDVTSAKMLARNIRYAQQKGVDPNVEKLMATVIKYEISTGKQPTKVMQISKSMDHLPSFMSLSVYSNSDGESEQPAQVMASKARTKTTFDQEEDRSKYWSHFDPIVKSKRDAARQINVKNAKQHAFNEGQPFFCANQGKPTLYFPHAEGYYKINAYSLPSPETFLQAVTVVKENKGDENQQFFNDLKELAGAKKVDPAKLQAAVKERKRLPTSLIESVSNRLGNPRYPKRTSINVSKSAASSRDSSASSYKSATSAASSPGSSKNVSDAESRPSRGKVKNSVYVRDSSTERSPSLSRSKTKNKKTLSNRTGTKPKTSKQRERSSSIKRFVRAKEMYPDMKLGINCRPTYRPDFGPSCMKCMTDYDDKGSHFEFRCPKYDRYNKEPCRICLAGYHFEDKCEAGDNVFPPPNLNANSVAPRENLIRLQKQLEDLLAAEKN